MITSDAASSDNRLVTAQPPSYRNPKYPDSQEANYLLERLPEKSLTGRKLGGRGGEVGGVVVVGEWWWRAKCYDKTSIQGWPGSWDAALGQWQESSQQANSLGKDVPLEAKSASGVGEEATGTEDPSVKNLSSMILRGRNEARTFPEVPDVYWYIYICMHTSYTEQSNLEKL